MTAAAPLLTRADLAVLGRLGLDSLDALLIGLGGERQGPGRSAGFEFIDYRRYVPGDDVASDRLERLCPAARAVRPHRAARGPRRARRPGRRESLDARRVAASSRRADGWRRCSAPWPCFTATPCRCTCSATVTSVSGGLHDSSAALLRVAYELESLRVGTTTDLAASVRRAREASGQAGLAVLITDMLVPAGARRLALRELGHDTRSVALLHVIADDSAVAHPATYV